MVATHKNLHLRFAFDVSKPNLGAEVSNWLSVMRGTSIATYVDDEPRLERLSQKYNGMRAVTKWSATLINIPDK